MKVVALLCVSLLIQLSAVGQIFYNLDFEQSCDSSKTGLCHWDLSWGGKNACTREVSGNNQCLLIVGKTEASVGFAEQSAQIENSQGLQMIDVSAKISSENIKGKGAGINIEIYDSANNLLFNKDMGYASFNWIHGTTGDKEYSVRAMCPSNAAKIKIGAILYGKGKARFDNFKVVMLPIEGRKASQLAVKYVSSACDTILKHSLYKDSINMDNLKRTALEIAGPAQSYADCHLAIEYLLSSLGDHHSFFMTPVEIKNWENDTTENANIHYAQYKVIDRCGYISIPPFHGGNKKLMIAYCDSIQKDLRILDSLQITGWIVDIRENTGGNMEPMITGLGPLFDFGKLGFLVDINGHKESWSYKNGTYYWEAEAGISATHPVKLSTQLPIAVLIGNRTGSSGECVVVSFIGNSNTKIIGQPTWGLTTGNGAFDLSDGARMMLASTVMADRSGKCYRGKIEPDVMINPDTSNGDAGLNAAIQWILNKK